MTITVYFQPVNKIDGVREGSSEFDTAQEALAAVEGLERSDEKVRIVGNSGREITKSHLEMLAEAESN
ncbi:hypothetical protein [Leisingera sp. ANG-M7]|uniref:hypothetical protein n=1 Tax=Leisingera sp. ANG-M7 TaxID=1577902 RepID=UPI00057D50A3|nr:hypothetical protein [Leisingera sp. ANG-M7]KIC36544.1 hypothetical protein RA26_12475 [Leisingera sp. ANG-M7]